VGLGVSVGLGDSDVLEVSAGLAVPVGLGEAVERRDFVEVFFGVGDEVELTVDERVD
jgi:hypothetical protein